MAGTFYNTVYLTNFAVQNPFTVASNGLVSVSSGSGIVGTAGYAWTLFNQGTIESSGGTGVDLTAGGSVTNGRSGSSGGLISGSGPFGVGVAITGTGSVSNYGTITGSRYGVSISGTGTVSNFGMIAGAVRLAGGSVTNSGTITGSTGIYFRGTGTISNSGAITGTVVNSGIRLGAGLVVNAAGGTITGGVAQVFNGNQSVTVTNAGVITGATGVFASTIVNTGKISGTSGFGVSLGGATLLNSGLISGGVAFGSGAETVTNYGTISGATAVSFGGGADVLALGTASVITGTLAGFGINDTIDLLKLQATGAVFSGTTAGGTLTVMNGTAVVESLVLAGRFANNFAVAPDGHGGVDVTIGQPIGNIIGGTYGYTIVLTAPNANTTVTSTGRITAPSGPGIVNAAGVVGTLTNMGHVSATGNGGQGIYLGTGGFVTNSGGSSGGYISGAGAGVMIGGGAGTVTNSGTIKGGSGVVIGSGSSATVTDSGMIAGTAGTAVSLGGGNNRLILAPGAMFQGAVDGGGGASVVEVAASGPGVAGADEGTAATTAYISLGGVTNFSALQVDFSAAVDASGNLIFDTLVNQGQINLAAGDSLVVGTVANSANGGTIDLRSGGSVHFTGAVAAGQTVLFRPPGGTVSIDHPEQFAAAMTQFDMTDTIDLPLGQATFQQYAGGVLSLSYGGGTVALQLTTISATPQFIFTGDGHGGTDITVNDTTCFCRGTHILTDRGEVAVEDLAVGDRVRTLSGAVKPIVWIGIGRGLVTRKNRLARPIIVRRSALADNVPHRDLYLTHGHALYFASEEVLIPVEHLVNHRSILWDEADRVVEYYHIELEDHDVLLAEGAPAESYYDADNRALFHHTRPGSQPGAATTTFAPVQNGGELVETVWARLYARAGGEPGGKPEREVTADPDLHLVVDRERIDPEALGCGVYRFAVARPPVDRMLLRSRCGVPSLLGLGRSDHRRLGVAIQKIVWHHAGIASCFDYDQPQLREGGCYQPENGFCWTDGELQLPGRFFSLLNGAFTLVVHTQPHPEMRYPVAAPLTDETRQAA